MGRYSLGQRIQGQHVGKAKRWPQDAVMAIVSVALRRSHFCILNTERHGIQIENERKKEILRVTKLPT
jgi:hypothetical protein